MLVKNTTVVTMDADNQILKDVDVFVKDGRFAAIGKDLQTDGEGYQQVIDGTKTILMPGLINMHSHIGMSLFRNYGNDVDLQTWLEKYIFPKEALLTREDVMKGSALNILEMLLTGTTTFVDMYYEMDGVAEVVSQMGIRARLSRGMTGPDDGTRIREQRELYQNWHGFNDDMITVMIGPHAIYTNTKESLAEQKALGDELGMGFNIHISETKRENDECREEHGKSPVEVFHDMGMLTESTIVGHAVWVDARDIELLAANKVSCVYNPASNMKLASGFMPVKKLRDGGVNVCLGTDGASSNNKQDMFREMYLGTLIQKGYSLNPLEVTARDMLRMATINGAIALGMENEIGSIEVGKKADFILVDFDNAHHTPYPEDIEAALVYSTSGSDVVLTVVNGEVRVENGFYMPLEDGRTEEIIREEAEEAWARLAEKEA